MLLFRLQVSEFALLCFCLVFGCHEDLHLLFILLSCLLVISSRSWDVSSVFVFNLELSDQLGLLPICLLQLVILLLVRTDCKQKLRVSLFFSHEFLHDFSNVWVVGLGSDLLETFFNALVLSHLSAHSLLVEGGPESVYEQVLAFLYFFHIFGLVLSQFGDFSLAFCTSHSFLQRILLVLNWSLQRRDSFLTLLLFVVNQNH